ncbi:hypothetical protein ACIBJF_50535 [Streptomyces sp. NPDC050743]|uniref:hypothetical protein n=1 Tax=Streptomyces sp. NPDC050743 TaxID=3365634 RepID=UPI0037A4E45C
MCVDADLLTAAAESSESATADAVDRAALAAFIAALPAAEKDSLLLEAALGTAPLPSHRLLARYRATTAPRAGAKRRTAAQLLDAAYRHRTERRQREKAARAAAEQARARAAAEAREAHLDQLARNTGKAWRDIDDLIAQKKAAAYDAAIALLRDLRDIQTRTGCTADFDRRVGELRAAHRGKPSLMQRFDSMGIPNP